MTDQEIIDNMRLLLHPINKKLEIMENHMTEIEHKMAGIEHEISGIKYEMSNLKLEMHRGFRKNDDEIETLIAVLEAKGILPKAQ